MYAADPNPPCRCPECGNPLTEREGLPRFDTKTTKDPDSDRIQIEVRGLIYDRCCRCGCHFPETVEV